MSNENVNHYGKRLVSIMMVVVSMLATGCAEKEEVDKDWVDLGLPSGLLWATRNVGASSPEDYGDYFAWRETTPKDVYDRNTYTKDNIDSEDYTLQPDEDAATANYGGRTPSREDWMELERYTTHEWKTIKGVTGWRFTGSNGSSIFIPAAGTRSGAGLSDADSRGYYWTSSFYPWVHDPYYYGFWHGGFYSNGYHAYFGLSVRAVRQK